LSIMRRPLRLLLLLLLVQKLESEVSYAWVMVLLMACELWLRSIYNIRFGLQKVIDLALLAGFSAILRATLPKIFGQRPLVDPKRSPYRLTVIMLDVDSYHGMHLSDFPRHTIEEQKHIGRIQLQATKKRWLLQSP
jgi:hypothetical protein